ncbi:hypothetical protein [Brevibacillus choshinensis]|uniref:hypothetical protein n=1 Tax=Brevibacillus choshinensis TaxID=54911 RepID=UPI002E22CB21|nr:hypothetical protein [Brevibacillus choshinensis]
MKKANMKGLVMELTSEGENIPFDDFLIQMSGSGEIYEEWYGDYLEAAVSDEITTDNIHDYLLPLTREVLLEAVREDKEVYMELATSIWSAYNQLKKRHELRRGFIDLTLMSE